MRTLPKMYYIDIQNEPSSVIDMIFNMVYGVDSYTHESPAAAEMPWDYILIRPTYAPGMHLRLKSAPEMHEAKINRTLIIKFKNWI